MESNSLALEVLKQMKEQHSVATKRLITALIIIVVLFVGTNIFWIYKCYSPVDTETISQEADDGENNYIGNDGEINNGKTNDN